uniref:Deoxyribodipyrimidine photo-lyase n=2 Tax=Dunaliella TaxID=3044 RepID=A0A7S3QK81_DUNTE|nr:CPD photolyase [Dunaliella salina]|mmetsp:Transcript_5499/g.14847  ORF Transcript_5499/g.14847 Transcript_5499/m.14847 type:complete len:530 (-) Transcript_5499:1000-2589(-)
MPKRKAQHPPEDDPSAGNAGPSSQPSSANHQLVDQRRVSELLSGNNSPTPPVVYWMSRDMRVSDNWALLQGCQEALQRLQLASHADTAAAAAAATAAHSSPALAQPPLVVAFNLVPQFLGAGARSFCFMLKGLRELETKLRQFNIPFYLLRGQPEDTIPQLVDALRAGLVVSDYSPLRLSKQWKQQVAAKLQAKGVGFQVVDAHNVVPAKIASNKREYAARTIRPKIEKLLPEFLIEFPNQGLPPIMPTAGQGPHPPTPIDWPALLAEVTEAGAAVPEVDWITPGEAAARAALDGSQGFLTTPRIAQYHVKRNDPSCTTGLSNLSPYLHFGQLSAQRAALEASKLRSRHREAVDRYLEELIVRRELADNFCEHCPDYDKLVPGTAYDWALKSLEKHKRDPRPITYTRQQLESGHTGDDLWNAGQMELVRQGKMHGYIRMYWAKKILEWSGTPEEAVENAIYLNDKWSLDGRDPSGYTGVMWSVAGVHDRAWIDRPIYGKIRVMTYDGCKGKFDVPAYVAYVESLGRARQ